MTEPEPEFERVGPWQALGGYRAALIIPQDALGRVLLQLRDDIAGIAHPGKWGLFGGEIEAGETPLQAAVREFEEETGLALPAADFRPAYATLTGAPKWGLLRIFTLTLSGEPSDIALHEGAGFAFLTRQQIAGLDVIPHIAKVLDRYWESE